ncbi:hypothetical protein [Streptomyces sp. NPDC090026]|uniref:hypothetical protein n=1 Tax=Streptomyces sp. NPDC090026 TaxID=3365923 RepID=UPI00381FE378
MPYTPPKAGSRLTTDVLEGMVGEWQDYTPAWAASTTNPSIGNGTLLGRYCVIGDTVHFSIKLTGGSTTTWGSGLYRWDLPVPAAPGIIDHIGVSFIGDSSVGGAGYSTGIAYLDDTGAVVRAYVGNQGAATGINSTHPQTFATGDRIWIHGTYEAA